MRAFAAATARPQGSLAYQSLPRMSPPLRVQAAHHVVALTPLLTLRMLPSARPTMIVPEWGDDACPRSHLPAVVLGAEMPKMVGLASTPVYHFVPSPLIPPPNTADTRSPG